MVGAALGLVVSAVYALSMLSSILHGEREHPVNDATYREVGMLLVMLFGLLVLGVYAVPVLDLLEPAVIAVQGGK